MIEFIKTIAISAIPSIIAGLSAYLAARNKSNTQIKTITEQNKADIEKIVEQHKIDIDALKEKHILDLEVKEKDHEHQVEIINLQHKNETFKSEDAMKNNFVASLMGDVLSGNSDLASIMKKMTDIKKFTDDLNK